MTKPKVDPPPAGVVSPDAYERLAAVDLASVSAADLARTIELEAEKLLGVRNARLVAGPDSAGAAPGVEAFPIGDHTLICEGGMNAGSMDEAKRFGAQAGALLRAHHALGLNRSHEMEISALYAALAQLTARRDLGAVLKTVVERARELLSSDLAYIMLLDEPGRSLRIRVASGNRTDAFLRVTRPVRPGVSAYAGVPIRTADFLNDSGLDHHPATDELVRLEGLKSVMAVPLRTELAALGTLCVANRYLKEFTEHEVSLLNTLGEHAALALDNARLYENAVSAAASSAKAQAEAESHLQRLERTENLHHKLTEVLLAGQGVSGVVATLAASFNAGFVVADWRHRVLADANSGLIDRQGEINSTVRRRRDVVQALDRCANSFETAEAGGEFVIAPIAARRELLGYIWGRHLDPQKSDAVLPTSLEQAARVVALEMMREREAVETERRLRRDFMYELLSENTADVKLLESRARQMWRGYAVEHRPLVISAVAKGAVGASPLERARRLLSEDRPADFVTVYGSNLVLLTNSVERSRTQAEAESMQRLLAANGIVSGIAIGAVCRGLAETRTVTLMLKRLIDILSPSSILWAEGLEALTLLFDLTHADRLEAFVRNALRPFGGNELYMSTLLAYYEAGGNRTAAARSLRTHVNTLRSRLERIQELVGGSVDDSARAVPLRLALLARGLYSDN